MQKKALNFFLHLIYYGTDSMSYAQLYAQAIYRICVQRGITPEQLADLCGVTPLTMKRILSGTTRHARVGTMRRIAAALDISLTELLDLPREEE